MVENANVKSSVIVSLLRLMHTANLIQTLKLSMKLANTLLQILEMNYKNNWSMNAIKKIARLGKITLIATLVVISSSIYESKQRVELTEQQCLIANVFFEARGESLKGMKAVAAVTLNRVDHKSYPGSVCAVVFQKKQFSWSAALWLKGQRTHRESLSKIFAVLKGDTSGMQQKDKDSYKKVVDIAALPRAYFLHVLPRNVIYFHAVNVKPAWSKGKVLVARIGNHNFYR